MEELLFVSIFSLKGYPMYYWNNSDGDNCESLLLSSMYSTILLSNLDKELLDRSYSTPSFRIGNTQKSELIVIFGYENNIDKNKKSQIYDTIDKVIDIFKTSPFLIPNTPMQFTGLGLLVDQIDILKTSRRTMYSVYEAVREMTELNDLLSRVLDNTLSLDQAISLITTGFASKNKLDLVENTLKTMDSLMNLLPNDLMYEEKIVSLIHQMQGNVVRF